VGCWPSSLAVLVSTAMGLTALQKRVPTLAAVIHSSTTAGTTSDRRPADAGSTPPGHPIRAASSAPHHPPRRTLGSGTEVRSSELLLRRERRWEGGMRRRSRAGPYGLPTPLSLNGRRWPSSPALLISTVSASGWLQGQASKSLSNAQQRVLGPTRRRPTGERISPLLEPEGRRCG
jgi:hypothetical protein